MSDAGPEYVPQEKAGRIAWLLARGARLTVRQVAELTGLRRRAATDLLNTLSRVLPIYRGDDGRWTAIDLTGKDFP